MEERHGEEKGLPTWPTRSKDIHPRIELELYLKRDNLERLLQLNNYSNGSPSWDT